MSAASTLDNSSQSNDAQGNDRDTQIALTEFAQLVNKSLAIDTSIVSKMYAPGVADDSCDDVRSCILENKQQESPTSKFMRGAFEKASSAFKSFSRSPPCTSPGSVTDSRPTTPTPSRKRRESRTRPPSPSPSHFPFLPSPSSCCSSPHTPGLEYSLRSPSWSPTSSASPDATPPLTPLTPLFFSYTGATGSPLPFSPSMPNLSTTSSRDYHSSAWYQDDLLYDENDPFAKSDVQIVQKVQPRANGSSHSSIRGKKRKEWNYANDSTVDLVPLTLEDLGLEDLATLYPLPPSRPPSRTLSPDQSPFGSELSAASSASSPSFLVLGELPKRSGDRKAYVESSIWWNSNDITVDSRSPSPSPSTCHGVVIERRLRRTTMDISSAKLAAKAKANITLAGDDEANRTSEQITRGRTLSRGSRPSRFRSGSDLTIADDDDHLYGRPSTTLCRLRSPARLDSRALTRKGAHRSRSLTRTPTPMEPFPVSSSPSSSLSPCPTSFRRLASGSSLRSVTRRSGSPFPLSIGPRRPILTERRVTTSSSNARVTGWL